MRLLRFLIFFLLFVFIQKTFAEIQIYHYKVKWLGIPAGKIEIRVQKLETQTYIRAESKTIGIVKLIMPFKSCWETWLAVDGYPIRTHIWRKGRGKAVIKEFFFDQKNGLIKRIKNGKAKIYKVNQKVHDELSAFIRALNFKWKRSGEIKNLWIFAHGKANKAILQCIGKEKINSRCGKVNAWKIKTEFTFKSELINRSRQAIFWIYQDKVFKGEGDLPIGHLTAILMNPGCEDEVSKESNR